MALDCALGGCSAAAVADDRTAHVGQAMARGQAEYLVPFAQGAMDKAEIAFDDLDAILCTVGPGAFTGIRIGLSAARSFGLSLDIPVIGVTTTQALAFGFVEKERRAVSVVLETKRKDFYVQNFDDKGVAIGVVRALRYEEMADFIPDGSILIGDGVSRFLSMGTHSYELAQQEYLLCDMVLAAKMLQKHGADGQFFSVDAQPVYLRDADVSVAKNKPRVLEDVVE